MTRTGVFGCFKEAQTLMFGGHVWYQKEVGNIFRIKKQKVKKIKSYMSSKKNPKRWVSDYFLVGSTFGMENQSRIQGWQQVCLGSIFGYRFLYFRKVYYLSLRLGAPKIFRNRFLNLQPPFGNSAAQCTYTRVTYSPKSVFVVAIRKNGGGFVFFALVWH